jgi:hypothetical protein
LGIAAIAPEQLGQDIAVYLLALGKREIGQQALALFRAQRDRIAAIIPQIEAAEQA